MYGWIKKYWFMAGLIAISIIFLISPLTALLSGQLPLDTGVKIGIFLVAVMPTTFSSGVVMTGASDGNMAHALVITILSNGLALVVCVVHHIVHLLMDGYLIGKLKGMA